MPCVGIGYIPAASALINSRARLHLNVAGYLEFPAGSAGTACALLAPAALAYAAGVPVLLA